MTERGFTIVEALLGVAITGIVLMGLLPTFLTCLDVNTHNEERMGAAAVAQQTVEALRQADPTTLPSSGSSPVQVVTVDDRDYEVVTHYCTVSEYCDTDTRHLLTEVTYGGKTLASVETVYTAVR